MADFLIFGVSLLMLLWLLGDIKKIPKVVAALMGAIFFASAFFSLINILLGLIP